METHESSDTRHVIASSDTSCGRVMWCLTHFALTAPAGVWEVLEAGGTSHLTACVAWD